MNTYADSNCTLRCKWGRPPSPAGTTTRVPHIQDTVSSVRGEGSEDLLYQEQLNSRSLAISRPHNRGILRVKGVASTKERNLNNFFYKVTADAWPMRDTWMCF